MIGRRTKHYFTTHSGKLGPRSFAKSMQVPWKLLTKLAEKLSERHDTCKHVDATFHALTRKIKLRKMKANMVIFPQRLRAGRDMAAAS